MSKNKLNKMKLDLYLKELNLLESEKQYVDEFTSHYKPQFMEDAIKLGYVSPIITGETNSSCGIKKDKAFEVTNDDKKTIKTIFRSIAKECHPDKTKSPISCGNGVTQIPQVGVGVGVTLIVGVGVGV
jgi:hypothetical protein